MEVYMTSPVLIDVILLATLLFFVLMGAKRGFILTLCSLVAVVVALVGANLAADTLSPKVADAIRPRLEQAIQESLEEKALEVGMSAADMDVLAVLKEKGGLYEWAADAVGDVLHSSDLIPSAASIAANTAAALAQQLARGLIFLVAFLLVLLAWTLLSHALDLVAKLPGINGLNRTLGAALGFLKGLVVLYLASWVLCTLTGFIPPETAEKTRLMALLIHYDPLTLFGLL